MKKVFLTLLLALLIPMPAQAIDWLTVWTGSISTFGGAKVKPGQVAFIVVADTVADDEISPVLTVTRLASFCYDTNDATLPGASEGTGTIDVLLIAAAGNVNGEQAVSMGTISAASPCVHAGPGPIVLHVTTIINSAGTVVVAGY